MTRFAQRVAEGILNEAQSGSGYWDELNGPSATLQQIGDDKFTVRFPQGYDEQDQPTGDICLVTVEILKGEQS